MTEDKATTWRFELPVTNFPEDFQQLLEDFEVQSEWVVVRYARVSEHIEESEKSEHDCWKVDDYKKVLEMIESIRMGYKLPPIVIDLGRCVDGHHRLAAYKVLGVEVTEAIYLEDQ